LALALLALARVLLALVLLALVLLERAGTCRGGGRTTEARRGAVAGCGPVGRRGAVARCGAGCGTRRAGRRGAVPGGAQGWSGVTGPSGVTPACM
ncbi:MAG TPA: hypothetical protein VIV12_31340, partial [Streptosporangiaceae bacterium]